MNLATLQNAINNSSNVSETLKVVDALTQEKPMDIHLTAQEFISEFSHEDDATDFILGCDKKGLVSVVKNTLPTYLLKSDGSFGLPLGGGATNIHSIEVRIERYYEDGDSCADAVVTFRFGEEMDLFYNHLSSDLSGLSEKREMHPQTDRLRERDALALQISLNQDRIYRSRRYLAYNGLNLHPDEFDANCKLITNLNDFNDKAFARIEDIGY